MNGFTVSTAETRHRNTVTPYITLWRVHVPLFPYFHNFIINQYFTGGEGRDFRRGLRLLGATRAEALHQRVREVRAQEQGGRVHGGGGDDG